MSNREKFLRPDTVYSSDFEVRRRLKDMLTGVGISFEDGEEPPRTKLSHPYNYDPILLLDSGQECNATSYTDRLFQGNHEKYTRLCKEHMPDTRWDNSPAASIEAFLRDYHGHPDLKLCRVIEYCNPSNGYPVWRLDYFYDQTQDKQEISKP